MIFDPEKEQKQDEAEAAYAGFDVRKLASLSKRYKKIMSARMKEELGKENEIKDM